MQDTCILKNPGMSVKNFPTSKPTRVPLHETPPDKLINGLITVQNEYHYLRAEEWNRNEHSHK